MKSYTVTFETCSGKTKEYMVQATSMRDAASIVMVQVNEAVRVIDVDVVAF